MLTKHSGQVYLALYKVDFRKAHAGLLAECYHLGLSPYRGDVVLFVGPVAPASVRNHPETT